MVRFVLAANVLTPLGIRLSKPGPMIHSLNLFDMSMLLTLQVLANKLLERRNILKDLSLADSLISAHRKERQCFDIGYF